MAVLFVSRVLVTLRARSTPANPIVEDAIVSLPFSLQRSASERKRSVLWYASGDGPWSGRLGRTADLRSSGVGDASSFIWSLSSLTARFRDLLVTDVNFHGQLLKSVVKPWGTAGALLCLLNSAERLHQRIQDIVQHLN